MYTYTCMYTCTYMYISLDVELMNKLINLGRQSPFKHFLTIGYGFGVSWQNESGISFSGFSESLQWTCEILVPKKNNYVIMWL